MTNKNDERILELRKLIEEKKEKLGKIDRFIATTNCSLELDNIRYNLHVLNKEQLTHLLVKLTTYAKAAKDLGVVERYVISGYNIYEWLNDIVSKLDILTKKDEERKLALMEQKLIDLLSDDKQIELEIDEIELFLKD